eukprot:35513_1
MVTFQATHVLNMNVFTSIFISLLIPLLHGAQRQIIPGSEQGFWSAAPSKTNAWVFDNNALVAIYPRCPSGDKCLRLKGYGSEALSYTSSLGYYSINAEWEMRTELLDSKTNAEKCKLFYILGAQTTDNDYINRGFFASDTQVTSYAIPLAQADNDAMVGIWFYLHSDEGAAYINYFRLTGIKITPPPTPYPTIHPTIPTSNPTLSPTAFPTLKPTVTPTQFTKYPTQFPSRHPSNSPSTHSTKSPSKHPTFNRTRTQTFEYQYTTESTGFSAIHSDGDMMIAIVLSLITLLVCVCAYLCWYFYHKNVKGEDIPTTTKDDNGTIIPKVVTVAPEMQRTGILTESVEMICEANGVQTPEGNAPVTRNEDMAAEGAFNVLVMDHVIASVNIQNVLADSGNDTESVEMMNVPGAQTAKETRQKDDQEGNENVTVDGQAIDMDVDVDQCSKCVECGAVIMVHQNRIELDVEGGFVCNTCKRLNNDGVDNEVDKMFDGSVIPNAIQSPR